MAGAALSDIIDASLTNAAYFLVVFVLSRFTAPAKLATAEQRSFWASSCLSTIHSVVIVYCTLNAVGPFLATTDLNLTSDASTSCGCIYLGYIVADSLPLLYHYSEWKGSGMYVVHHIASIGAWGLLVVRGQLHSMGLPLLLVELTAPFVNGRWFLSTLGYADSLAYKLNGLAMALSFFILRVVGMGWVLFRHAIVLRKDFFALPPSTWVVILILYAFGYMLQLMWFQKIFAGLMKVLGGGGKAK